MPGSFLNATLGNFVSASCEKIILAQRIENLAPVAKHNFLAFPLGSTPGYSAQERSPDNKTFLRRNTFYGANLICSVFFGIPNGMIHLKTPTTNTIDSAKTRIRQWWILAQSQNLPIILSKPPLVTHVGMEMSLPVELWHQSTVYSWVNSKSVRFIGGTHLQVGGAVLL